MAFVLRPPTEAPLPLADRLFAVGRSRRFARICTGVFSVVALTLAVALAAGVLDAAIHVSSVARAFSLAAVLAACGYQIAKTLLPSVRGRADSHATAMLLESGHPDLNDALASAVEFSKSSSGDPSERFRTVAVRRAENLLSRVDPHGVVPAGAAWRSFWLAAFAVGSIAMLVAFNPSKSARAAIRLFDPFGSHPWPAQTVIDVTEPTPFPYRMAKGDPLTIRVTVSGRIPELAILSLRLSDGPVLTEPVPLRPDEINSNLATATIPLDPSRIPRDFEVRLSANDADTGWLRVTVAPPPRLVPWGERPSPQISVLPPAYSGLPAADLPDGTGVIEAVAGTRVRFTAKTDRRIVAATLTPLGDPSVVSVAAALSPLATLSNPLLTPAAGPFAESFAEPIPVNVSGPDGTNLAADLIPRWPGLHALKITDESGLSGVRLFDFRVYPDPIPSVTLDRPAAGKDALILLPTARVRLETRADDRTFGLRTVWLEYRVRDGEFRPIPLADYAALGRTVPAVTGGAGLAFSVSSPAANVAGVMPLSRFAKPDGTAPADGDTVTLRTAADDWDDVSVSKTPGRSIEVTIRVVSKATLDAVLQKSLAEMRPQLREALERENEAQRLAAEVAKAVEESGKWSAESREKLARAEQLQRDAKAKLADPRDGLRAKAEDLQRTARANGLPPTGTAAQVEAAARTLTRLADEPLDAAEAFLNAARQAADRAATNPPDNANARDALAAARKQQQAVENGVKGLLDRLSQWGGAGEVRADAQTLKDNVAAAGDELMKRTGEPQSDPAKLAEQFNKLADDANALLSKADKIAGEKEKQAEGNADSAGEKAKAEAAALRDAVEKSGGQQLADDLRSAGAAAKAGRTGDAEAARASAAERLGKMTDALAEKRNEPTADELKKNRKRDVAELDRLKEEQDELRKKAKKAEAIENPEEKKTELERLADEQEKLQKETEKLAEKLTRDRAEKTADTVKRAAEQMAAAANEQRQGRPAGEELRDATEKLQDAQKEFKRETQSADEQLEREEREKIFERIKSLRDRQAAAVNEAKRLLAEALQAKRWDRPLLASLSDLADAEAAIAVELRPFVEKQFEPFPVFARVGSSAADAIERAKVRIGERKDDLLTVTDAFDAETETLAHGRVLQPMTLALKRLDLLLDAVKPDPKKPGGNGEPKPPGEGGGGEPPAGGEAGGQQRPGQAVPPLAQLKALRGLQADLNERTLEFQKLNPNPDKYDETTRDELKELERDQREISDLFEKLLPLLQPMPEEP